MGHNAELNRAIAIAVAETEGPEAGLRIVDGLSLQDFRYLHSTRAELEDTPHRSGIEKCHLTDAY